jgi:putative peptidoglycan lipid II flippase
LWGILAGSSVGLLASTLGRLYASTYFALGDTKHPLRYAVLRVVVTTVLGYLFAIPLPGLIGIDPKWGAAGLTLSAGLAGWIEMRLLRSTLSARIGPARLPLGLLTRLWAAAGAAAAGAWAIKTIIPFSDPVAVGLVVLGGYCLMFFAFTCALRVPEATSTLRRVLRGPAPRI